MGQSYNHYRRDRIDIPAVRAIFDSGRHRDGGYRFQYHTRINFYDQLIAFNLR